MTVSLGKKGFEQTLKEENPPLKEVEGLVGRKETRKFLKWEEVREFKKYLPAQGKRLLERTECSS